MARMARVVVPGLPHHVTQRGNRRQKTFFCDGDFEMYLALLTEWCAKRGTEIWAWCLMPNHVHLIAVPADPDGLRAALGETHRRYTRLINARKGWRGHLWQERFASFPLDENHLLAAARYVELNPVRAGLVRRPEDYRWSSARSHLRLQDDGITRVKPLLEMVGDWQSFLEVIDEPFLAQLRLHSRTGRPLGNPEFVDQMEEKLGRSLSPQKRGPKPKKRGS